MPDVYPRIKAEREAFADYLASVPESDWSKPSLCAGWTVKDAAAHIVAGSKMSVPTFLGRMVSAGFDFGRFNAKGLRAEGGATPHQLAADLRANAATKNKPPMAMLAEIVVHGEDIRRGLGDKPGEHPTDTLVLIADHFVKAPSPINGKTRSAGLSFRATDAQWASGAGPVVEGPILSIIQAVSGRRAALEDLTGDGLATLSSRC